MTASLITYATLYTLMWWIFGAAIVAGVLVTIYDWRRARKPDVPRMSVDAEPWNDPRDAMRKDQEDRLQRPSRYL